MITVVWDDVVTNYIFFNVRVIVNDCFVAMAANENDHIRNCEDI